MNWREKLQCKRPNGDDTSDKTPLRALLSPVTEDANASRVSYPEQIVAPAAAATCAAATVSDELGPIDVEPDAKSVHASALLKRVGVRIMELGGVSTIGIWSDLDGPEVRAALRNTFGSASLAVRYLDGPGVPSLYKLRRVKGAPVPKDVLAEMERNPVQPWKVRDRMLNEMRWRSTGISWLKWIAARFLQKENSD